MDGAKDVNKQKVVLVTGGTVRLGLAIAERLRAAGWRVITSSHRPDSGADIIADLSEPFGAAKLFSAVLELLGGNLAHRLCANGLENGIEIRILAGHGMLAGRHRTARSENNGNVHAKSANEHSRNDLVAVGNADHRIKAMGASNRFHRISDKLARRKRILHAGVAHRNTVAYGDSVELHGNAAGFLNAPLQKFTHLVEMAVPGNKALVAVANADKRLPDILALHAGGEEKTSVRCAGVAFFDLIGNHGYYLSFLLNR